MTNETEVIIIVYPTKTRSGLDRLTAKLYQYFTFKEEKASMLLYQFCKTEWERTLLNSFNSFYESNITLSSELGTSYTEKEKQSVDQTLSLRYKNSQKKNCKLNSTTH